MYYREMKQSFCGYYFINSAKTSWYVEPIQASIGVVINQMV